ncbi:MAG: hypothetical protein AAFV88_11375 [Planctomycetota bacterium]
MLDSLLTPMNADEVLSVSSEYIAAVVPHTAPDWMVPHEYGMTFEIGQTLEQSWRWLNTPATFVDGQPPFFRVEFVSPDPNVPPGFHVGVLNTHHGPGLNFAGVITEVKPMEYRDLQYYYGAYALSPRLIRPTRLQFWTERSGTGTRMRLQVDSLVRPRLCRLWTWTQRRFWNWFPWSMRRGIDAME